MKRKQGEGRPLQGKSNVKLKEEQDRRVLGTQKVSWNMSFRRLHISGMSGARSPSVRVFPCGVQNFIFQQIPRVAREATAGLGINLTHIFKSYFKLQALGTLEKIFLLPRQAWC